MQSYFKNAEWFVQLWSEELMYNVLSKQKVSEMFCKLFHFFETLHINVTLMFVEFSFLWDKIQVYLDSSKGRKTWVRKLVHFLTSLIPSFSGRQCGWKNIHISRYFLSFKNHLWKSPRKQTWYFQRVHFIFYFP